MRTKLPFAATRKLTLVPYKLPPYQHPQYSPCMCLDNALE